MKNCTNGIKLDEIYGLYSETNMQTSFSASWNLLTLFIIVSDDEKDSDDPWIYFLLQQEFLRLYLKLNLYQIRINLKISLKL